MERKDNELFAKRVIQYYQNVASECSKMTTAHFVEEGKSRQLIHGILKRFKLSGNTNFKPIPGRSPVKSAVKNVKRIEREFLRNPSVSVRAVAKKLKIPKSTVSDIKLKKLNISARVKKTAPKYTAGQETRCKTSLRKLYEKGLRKVLVIDDETYVPFDPADVPGRHYYHSQDPTAVPYEHRTKPKAKFPKRHLIWQAMDSEGNVSKPYFSDGTMTAAEYVRECLKKRLLPFIRAHHNINDVLFWPDMATAHYAKIVTDYLKAEKVPFVDKKENAPNVPQARGIEKFWALCKSAYGNRQQKPTSVTGFRRIWTKISKDIAEKSAKSIMDHAWKILRTIGYKGISGCVKF